MQKGSDLQDGVIERQSALASAVAGHPVEVLAGKPGEASWSNGRQLFVDPTLTQSALREACIAQAVLLAAGSLRAKGVRRLLGRPGVAKRYMALELSRGGHEFADRLPRRIEELLVALARGEPACSCEESLLWASESSRTVAELPAHLGTLRPARLLLSRSSSQAASAHATAHGAIRKSELDEFDEDDELDADNDSFLRLFSSPLGGGSVSDFFLKLLGFGRAKGGDDQKGSDDGSGTVSGEASIVTGNAPKGAQVLAQAPTAGGSLVPSHPRFTYPEWHERTQRYRRAHVHVHEFVPEPRQGAARERAQVSASAVRAQLARVGVEFERHRAQPDGHDLDLDRLVRFAVDRGDGAEAPRLHVASRRTRRDLSLLVLLDVSHSTGDGRENGQTIFGQERELAREIIRSCERMGDRVALYAFHSWGRHLVHLLRVKGFDERVSRQTQQRLDALEPAGLTRMGAAIRHATHLLAGDEAHSHRLMLLLSDGFAYDDEYAHEYAQADTQKALEEATRKGIACVCLNVGTSQDDATLKRLYGASAYLRCEDAGKAVPALRRLMRSAILRASASDPRRRKPGGRAA